MMETRLSTRLDRYPAKMVGRLADRLIEKYAHNAKSVFDPFCGSGAILVSAKKQDIPVAGIDLNPIARLFCESKINGFHGEAALCMGARVIDFAKSVRAGLPIRWDAKNYWFTKNTIDKFERLRASALEFDLSSSPEGRAILFALMLSVRTCSRADQRSPKPFISKSAILTRKGRHYCPYKEMTSVLRQLTMIYGKPSEPADLVFLSGDITKDESIPSKIGTHSHVITSPPYLNAQDYFRNFKLELHVLEHLLSFDMTYVRDHLVGTERGDLIGHISKGELASLRKLLPKVSDISARSNRLGNVVLRYCYDMGLAFDMIKRCLAPDGLLVLVCADNLIAGTRFLTWRVLQRMLEDRGFVLVDSFTDEIRDRMLAPRRSGHKGIIKEEVITAYRLH